MLLRHELLRLGELDALAAGRMPHGHAPFEHAGAHAHKGQPVAVRGVHIRLDFEDEARELLVLRVDGPRVRHARGGRARIGKKAVQERLDAEIVARRTEEHGRQLAGEDLLQRKGIARHVQ